MTHPAPSLQGSIESFLKFDEPLALCKDYRWEKRHFLGRRGENSRVWGVELALVKEIIVTHVLPL